MRNENYKLTQYSVNTILNHVENAKIAIPQLQRPFVWKGTQVRDLIDSLYQGYPIGYLIVWQSSSVRLKFGGKSSGKKILIDGQQRITALMAAILGREILDEKYRKKKIQIAFNPCAEDGEERFAVYTDKYGEDSRWIPDISVLFQRSFAYRRFEKDYLEKNPGTNPRTLDAAISRLKDIAGNEVGVIELSFLLDIDVVTEIFIRINSQGKPLNQEDFAMSRISVNEEMGGDLLQKAIDHFCHLCLMPEEAQELQSGDSEFTSSEYGKQIFWVADYRQNFYVPTYSDVLKTAFAAQFGKVKIGELVNYLSGKNPETKEISQAFAQKTFLTLKEGIMAFMAEENFKTFLDILNQGGFIRDRMAGSKSMLNAVYSVFLMMKKEGLSESQLISATMRWYLLSSLTGRYQTGVESTVAADFQGIREKGTLAYLQDVEREMLPASFWSETLPEKLKTTIVKSNVYSAYLAAMIKAKDCALFSKTKTMEELVAAQTDNTLLFSKAYLEKIGIREKELYGQVANCIYLEKEVKSFLKRKPPVEYLKAMLEQDGPVEVAAQSFTKDELKESLTANAIPTETAQMTGEDFEVFLAKRRQQMARKIQEFYESYREMVK